MPLPAFCVTIDVMMVAYIALNENIIITDCVSRDCAIPFHHMEVTVETSELARELRSKIKE